MNKLAQYVGILPSESRGVVGQSSLTTPAIRVSDKYENTHLVLDVSNVSGSWVFMTIYGKDPTSGNSYPIVQTPTINSATTTVVRVGPEYVTASGAGFVTKNDIMPYEWYTTITASGISKYSVGGSFI